MATTAVHFGLKEYEGHEKEGYFSDKVYNDLWDVDLFAKEIDSSSGTSENYRKIIKNCPNG